MKTLKVKLLTGRVDSEGSYAPGASIDVPTREAISLVESEQAIPLNKKAYEAAFKDIEALKLEDEERDAKANAIMKKESLELELKALYRDVALKTAEIEGVVLTEDEIEHFIQVSIEGEKFQGEDK